MKFIIEDKIHDTEKSNEIVKYKKSYPQKTIFGTVYVRRQTTLYKTKKGNWFSVSEGDYDKYEAHKETEESAKEILKQINQIDIYNKYFDQLEEA